MTAPSLTEAFQVGVHILKTFISDKTKKILAQTGDINGQGQVDGENVEWWQHVGFASRPAKAELGKTAAEAIVLRQGGHDVAFASQDLRGLDLYGKLAEGETCLYAAGSDGGAQARVLLKADGTIAVMTTEGNADGGKSMGLFIKTDGSISMVSSTGAALLIGTDGGIKLFNGSGGLQVKADGSIKIASGSKVEMSGASITLGGPTALPLAIGPQVVLAIGALQVQIAAVAAALVACMNIPGPILPPHGAAAAAATGAVTAGALITAAAAPLIPTKRTSAD